MDTVEKMINRLPDGQHEFVSRVRELILAAHPEVTEQLHFNTPFFSCRGWLCYFDKLDSGGLEIGFPKGYLLADPQQRLVARNRKVVRSLVFETPAAFDEPLFLSALLEAIGLNLQKKPKKKEKT